MIYSQIGLDGGWANLVLTQSDRAFGGGGENILTNLLVKLLPKLTLGSKQKPFTKLSLGDFWRQVFGEVVKLCWGVPQEDA